MMGCKFNFDPASALNILLLGAHSDDIEIGCGGTVLQLRAQFPKAKLHWVVFSAVGVRESEARRSAELFAGSALQEPKFKTFRDGFLPFHGAEVKAVFEDELKQINPDVIFTHTSADAHQDHRTVCELTKNTFRDHLIFEYEIPKYDGDLGNPSVFVPLTLESCEKKVCLLLDCFESQRSKRWFEPSTFKSLMRLRGMECNAESGYAEAFHCRKLIF